MALDPTVARARFAAFIGRALREARQRGLTDVDIKRLTGITPATFHKWKTLDGGLPKIDKVQAFCRGLDIPPAAAYAALGIDDTREPTPELELDPDLKRVARILADPNVPEDTKQAIRLSIRMLSRAARTEAEHID
jgi:transcriptional regulator with XRE-family HTH domain